MAEEIPKKLGAGGLGLAFGQGPTDLKKLWFELFDLISAVNVRMDAQQAALDALVAQYNLHRGAAGVHIDADAENVIAATAATDPVADILVLINDEAAMYLDHYQNVTGSIHGAATDPNIITETNPATNEAEGILLVNDVKAMYNLHRVNTTDSVHGSGDSTNTVAEGDATDWDSCVTLANAIKNSTGFNAHISLEGGVHGADGAADAITADDSGAQLTALFAELIELKDDYSLHTADEGYHVKAGTVESTTDATTEATSVALANALKATLNTHNADAAVHLDADPETVDAADATEYEDILPIVAEVRLDYTAHLGLSAVHAKADAGNAGAALGTGAAVTVADYLSKEA